MPVSDGIRRSAEKIGGTPSESVKASAAALKVRMLNPEQLLINAALEAARNGLSIKARMMAATILLNEQCSEADAARAFESSGYGSCTLEHARNLIYNVADFISRERKQVEHQKWWDAYQEKRKSHLRVILGGKNIQSCG
ncbi:MAG TPA: hypothetical protein VHW01_04850 [Polyangiaceae bacterium]|nr:hypothetical protein [Polyangiaceae bacterium]